MIPMRRRAIVWLIASGALITGNPLRAAQEKPAPAAAAQGASEPQDITALSQAVEAVIAGSGEDGDAGDERSAHSEVGEENAA